jgi:hypothetical protein
MASASITMRNPRKRLCPFLDSVQPSKKHRSECSGSSDSQVSMFSLLPDEIVVEILRSISCPHDLQSVSSVCRQFSKLHHESSLWRDLCNVKFPWLSTEQTEKPVDEDWKAYFIRLYRMPVFSNDRERLRDAFSALRKLGITAKMSFSCCSNCGWREVKQGRRGTVFWHMGMDKAFKQRRLVSKLALAWRGNKQLICDVLSSRGLNVEVPLDNSTPIFVHPQPRHYVPNYECYSLADEYVSDGECCDDD